MAWLRIGTPNDTEDTRGERGRRDWLATPLASASWPRLERLAVLRLHLAEPLDAAPIDRDLTKEGILERSGSRADVLDGLAR